MRTTRTWGWKETLRFSTGAGAALRSAALRRLPEVAHKRPSSEMLRRPLSVGSDNDLVGYSPTSLLPTPWLNYNIWGILDYLSFKSYSNSVDRLIDLMRDCHRYYNIFLKYLVVKKIVILTLGVVRLLPPRLFSCENSDAAHDYLLWAVWRNSREGLMWINFYSMEAKGSPWWLLCHGL